MTLREDIAARTRIITDTEGEVAAILREALVRIQAVLAGQPSDAQRWQLTAIDAEIRRVLEELGAQAGTLAALAHGTAATAGAAMVTGAVARAGVAVLVPRINTQQLLAMREFTTAKINGVTLASANAINTELGLTMMGAKTPFEAAQQISKILTEATTDRAARIVRTELARAYSAAAQARLGELATQVPGMKKRWVKSGKTFPRQHHAIIHGQIRRWDEPYLLKGGKVKLMYPHDPAAPASETINCGCLSVPVVPKP